MWGWALWGMRVLTTWLYAFFLFFLNFNCPTYSVFNFSAAGCGVRDKPGHAPCFGDCSEETFTNVSRRTGQIQVGQHHGRFLRGHSPQSHSEDIRGQSCRHNWRSQEKPRCLCTDCSKKVSLRFMVKNNQSDVIHFTKSSSKEESDP